MTRRPIALAIALAAAVLAVLPGTASAEVPVVVRVIKGSRQGPPGLDPRIEDMKRQLSPLAYVRWEQLQEKRFDLVTGKPAFVELADGEIAGVTLQERRGDTITIEVALVSRNTQTRITVEKGQRILHQLTAEKDGASLFLAVNAWP